MTADQRAKSVFINCPFDKQYQALFNSLVFTIAYCGFQVRSALEVVDSGETRLAKIIALIAASKFSIHDISRVELDADTDLPRFNMPIELGIAIGMKHLGRKSLRDHCLRVLDGAQKKDQYRYQKFASDLAGVDIEVHGGKTERIIAAVREFLSPHVEHQLPGPRAIGAALEEFDHELPAMVQGARQSLDELTFVDRLRHASAFISRSA